jgi:predicted phage tail protein
VSIFGAGGGGGKGGGGGRKATEAKDNLDSTSYAKIIELLSEGEIEGFATPSRLGLT